MACGCLALLWLLLAAQIASAQGGVEVTKIVSTSSGDDIAFNGETIAYTIIVENNTGDIIRDLLILDVLPESVLTDITCLDAAGNAPCGLINETRTIPEPLGGTLVVTTTRQITWTLESLADNSSIQRSFTARVVGQTDGTIFTNVAFVSYFEGNSNEPVTDNSNEVRTTVRVLVSEDGQTQLSDSPTWFSSDVGGTLSMDWADFDSDGDLDLALGSTLGTTVYRNAAGRMQEFWSSQRRAYGVRWLDASGDGVPQLVAVGEVDGDATENLAQQPGNNYIYTFDPTASATGRRFAETDVFSSTFQMVRVEVGDMTGDGLADIVASTNAINPNCPVRLFVNDGSGDFSGPGLCTSRAATAAIKPGDFDNDGDLDLALGLFPNRVRILRNDGAGAFSPTDTVSLEESVMFLPYDFAWGDFDADGWLDIAAAYPLLREMRIYRNLNGQGFDRPISIRTRVFLTPYALDWGDFSGDGRIELAVADSPPRIYRYTGGYTSDSFELFFALGDGVVRGQVWSVRAIDQNNDGDIDLALSDRDGPSLVISNFQPPLNRALSPVEGVPPFPNTSPASSVSWGDADGDGTLDLLLGSGSSAVSPAALNTKLYFNEDGRLLAETVRSYSGFGPHETAFADVNGDGTLDTAIGATAEVRIYPAGDFLAPAWSYAMAGDKTLAFGDVDGDVDLDLLVGASSSTSSGVSLFQNDGQGGLGINPVWSDRPGNVFSVAYADYDNDGFLDFSIGLSDQAIVYRNNRDSTFSSALDRTLPVSATVTSMAWADYDGDGDLDLTLGIYGAANVIYENQGGDAALPFVKVWESKALSRTTGLDWADWDNDGDLDLAVGNDGELDQIYVNLGSVPGAPQLFFLWSSQESLQTSDVAWGDKDNDGDVDLAISQNGTALNGVYENNYTVPTHIAASGVGGYTALINQPSYVYVERPGMTNDAYDYSSAEVLSGPKQGEITVNYTLYNASGQRAAGNNDNATGTPILASQFEYSLNGGGTWLPATPVSATIQPMTTTSGFGTQAVFIWDAVANQAISDNARFRITVIDSAQAGPNQRASASAISPPFRVRAVTCIWPEGPAERLLPSSLVQQGPGSANTYRVEPFEEVQFTGRVDAGTGAMFYTWDFGDGNQAAGQVVSHSFPHGTFTVRMSVHGEECPATRERNLVLKVISGLGGPSLYLPAVSTQVITETDGITGTQTIAAAATSGGEESGGSEAVASHDLAPVSGFTGSEQMVTGSEPEALWLRWQEHSQAELIRGYRIYQGDRNGTLFRPVATVENGATAYRLPNPPCDQIYYVTALTDDMESPVSTSSYYGHLCDDG